MPRIRIEWVPVHAFGLGFLGFDHLQLVYQQDAGEGALSQDEWYVLEGVREKDGEVVYLGIEGADGRTTLAAANLAARADLIAKIGTPDYRGSRPLPYDGNELKAWETMAAIARDIERQDFPYFAYSLPGSPIPTINSSSAVASLIHYSGLDPFSHLPFGMRMSPGTTTLLGTGGDDAMRAERGFTTFLGGDGRDTFTGRAGAAPIEKFYGGTGDDLFHWSPGFNIIHGGQPQLDYAADGTDIVDYSGAGTVTITFNRHWVPHKVPNYVAAFDGGLDHLYSIERIQWNAATDRIFLGKGVGLVEDDNIREHGTSTGASVPSQMRSGRLVPDEVPAPLLGDGADNILVGTTGDDVLYGGGGNDTLIGGAGSDSYVYLPSDGDDVIVDDGPETDVDELILAGGIEPADVSAARGALSDDLVLSVRGSGSVLIKGFFAHPAAGIERVIFDRSPPWSRADLKQLAAAPMPPDDDTLVFRPEIEGTGTLPNAVDINDALRDVPAAAPYSGGDTIEADVPAALGIDFPDGWLF
jgi:Ca2+-binding RTX toxin-like protein